MNMHTMANHYSLLYGMVGVHLECPSVQLLYDAEFRVRNCCRFAFARTLLHMLLEKHVLAGIKSGGPVKRLRRQPHGAERAEGART